MVCYYKFMSLLELIKLLKIHFLKKTLQYKPLTRTRKLSTLFLLLLWFVYIFTPGLSKLAAGFISTMNSAIMQLGTSMKFSLHRQK